MGAMCTGNRQWSCTQLIGHHPIEMALAVAELSGQSGNAVTLDHAVGDHPHRPSHHVAAQIPFGRSGRCVRPTSLACSEATLLRCCRSVVELDVGLLGGDRRATRPTVDTRGSDGGDEHAVEASVAAFDDAVAMVVVERWHGSIMADVVRDHQRKSATQIDVRFPLHLSFLSSSCGPSAVLAAPPWNAVPTARPGTRRHRRRSLSACRRVARGCRSSIPHPPIRSRRTS